MGFSSTITSELDGHQWLIYTLAAIIPGWKPGNPEIEGLVGPRDSMDLFEEKKILCSYQDWNPGLPSKWNRRYTDHAIPAWRFSP
jgi:hypothetical protein